jgi:hypothetical protein
MRRSAPRLLALSLLLAGACSDDAKPANDAAPDRGVVDLARDRSAPEASATDARRDRPAPDAAPVTDTKPATDRPAEAKPPPDLAQADLGKSKLLIWTTCSTNPKCKPYCGAIGSKSEGWFDPCTTQLMKNPTTGQPYWDQCATCVVACEAIGTFSEGWYAHCP